jgi:dephospho-CoA kinase
MANTFGGSILKTDGSVDTLRLGEIVFPSLARRQELNRLVYPRFLRALRRGLRDAREARRPVVADVAVYFDLGAPKLGLPVVLVQAPLKVRVQRLRRLGVPAERARARAQALRFGPAERRAADLVLDGTRDAPTLLRALAQGLAALPARRRPAHAGISRVS